MTPGPPPRRRARRRAAQAQAQQPVGPKEWAGLKDMPAKTQASLNEVSLQDDLQGPDRDDGRVRGQAGRGQELHPQLRPQRARRRRGACSSRRRSVPFSPRRAAGFTISLLDTPGLLEGDAVSQRGMSSVKLAMKDRKVHAVVYMDRLDSWRVDNSDRAMFKALADNFGMDIWERTVLGFSHGQLSPTQLPYDQFVEARANELRSAIRDTLNAPHLALPHAVVENGAGAPAKARRCCRTATAWVSLCPRSCCRSLTTRYSAPRGCPSLCPRSRTSRRVFSTRWVVTALAECAFNTTHYLRRDTLHNDSTVLAESRPTALLALMALTTVLAIEAGYGAHDSSCPCSRSRCLCSIEPPPFITNLIDRARRFQRT